MMQQQTLQGVIERILIKLYFVCCAMLGLSSCAENGAGLASSDPSPYPIELGPRPYFLVENMAASELKQQLQTCSQSVQRRQNLRPQPFSIGHRGAPLQFPEHTRESYLAAIRMGAGKVECDVVVTKDGALVCRHDQCDLHQTTNILLTPLAKKCRQPFSPATATSPAEAMCCSSDITLDEFQSLKGSMFGFNRQAKTAAETREFQDPYRTRLYSSHLSGELMTFAQSLALFTAFSVESIPELKAYDESLDELSYDQLRMKLIDELRMAGIKREAVFLQSFSLDDLKFWRQYAGDYASRLVFLDQPRRNEIADIAYFIELKQLGINTIAPALPMLLQIRENQLVPSAYALAARKAGMNIMTWTVERSGSLINGGGWYYGQGDSAQGMASGNFGSTTQLIKREGDLYEVLHVLVKDVGIDAVFSDWPATTTFYANCLLTNSS